MLFLEKHAVIWANINLLIWHTETRHQLLGLVHVFMYFMRLREDIVDQVHEIIIVIIGEEIL
jgi:hypothetical protein